MPAPADLQDVFDVVDVGLIVLDGGRLVRGWNAWMGSASGLSRDEALGAVWHLPAGEPLTGREFIRLAFGAAGKEPDMGVLSGFMVRVGGLFNPLVREFAEVGYQFARPFVMDADKFERAFGAQVTPHEEAIAGTLEFYRTRP